MSVTGRESQALPDLFLFGVPGKSGGASTKIAHLLKLLHGDLNITIVSSSIGLLKDTDIRQLTEPFGVRCVFLKDLPKKLRGVALGICELHFFTSGTAHEAKARGLKLIWSNEMMFPFKGEVEASAEDLIDRVLFVSEFQAKAFADIHPDVPSMIVGNYIDPDDYAWRERRNPVFTMDRLSRADTKKYPLDFPVFYEEMSLPEARYRVMAWSDDLRKQYRWHRFGPEWELLPANKESRRNSGTVGTIRGFWQCPNPAKLEPDSGRVRLRRTPISPDDIRRPRGELRKKGYSGANALPGWRVWNSYAARQSGLDGVSPYQTHPLYKRKDDHDLAKLRPKSSSKTRSLFGGKILKTGIGLTQRPPRSPRIGSNQGISVSPMG